MYLVEAIQDAAGARYAMVGLLPGICRLTDRLQNFGYKEVVSLRDSVLGQAGMRTRGHEFHYSSGRGGRRTAACTRPAPVMGMKALRGIVSRTSRRHTCICISMPARRCPGLWSKTPLPFAVSGKLDHQSLVRVGDVGQQGWSPRSYIMDKQGLRSGYTTGSCATAGAKAAALAIVQGKLVDEVEITLPRGERVRFRLNSCRRHSETAVECSVIKDAGDDPDVTHGAEIFTRIDLEPPPGLRYRAGQGIGTVTKSGLELAIGEPAINPMPRRMIRQALEECWGTTGTMSVSP